MALLAFDTLAISKELETAGFPPGQAAAQTYVLASLLEKIEAARMDEMATKTDLAANTLKIVDLTTNTLKIQENIKELDARIKELDVRIKELDLRIVSLDTSSKRYMKEMESNLRRDLKEMESNLRRDLKEMESNRLRDSKEFELRMIIKLGAISVTTIGLAFGIMHAFPPTVQFAPTSPPTSVTTADSQYPREPIPLRPPSPVPMAPAVPSAPANPPSGR
ncbi:MAG: hypothetical protein HQL65_17160 [Magnetococcales bacterium]|nr:hypothetical protein [Magnetococcales bacterium]